MSDVRNRIFVELRRQWVSAEDGRSSAALAAHLGTRPQVVSTWATGSDNRAPSWQLLMGLASELGLEVRLTDRWAVLTRARSCDGGPATRKDDVVFPLEV